MNFLKYVEGAKPGKRQKTTPTSEEKKNSKQNYELKRERKFQKQWLINRSWLRFDDSQNQMFCTSCETNNVDSAFTKGTSNFKLEAIRQHESSKTHVMYLHKFDKRKEPETSKASRCLFQLKKQEFDNLRVKFRNAHAIAKHHKSFKDYELLCRLDKVKGIDTGNSYTNDKACSMFVQSIASVSKQNIVEKLQNAEFISLTMDGSTDFTGDDLESIYARTCTNGIIEDNFLYIGEAESAGSADLYSFLFKVFAELDLTDCMNTKLIGFCADGASNMQGLFVIISFCERDYQINVNKMIDQTFCIP